MKRKRKTKFTQFKYIYPINLKRNYSATTKITNSYSDKEISEVNRKVLTIRSAQENRIKLDLKPNRFKNVKPDLK